MKNTIRIYGKALSLGLVALVALKPSNVLAACNIGPPGIINLVVAGGSDIVVDSSLRPGTSIGQPKPGDKKTFSVVCMGSVDNKNPVYFVARLSESVAPGQLYELKVGGKPSGVGLRLSLSRDGGSFMALPVSQQMNLPNSTDIPNNKPSYQATDQFMAALERTGNPVVYGQIDPGVLIGGAMFYNGTGETGTQYAFERISTGNARLVRPSCTIDSGSLNQTVDLGSYSVKDLSGANSATPWTPFKLVMKNCGASPDILVDITFGSAADRDKNNASLFSINADGPSGLGIALSTDDGKEQMIPGASTTFPSVSTGDSYKFRARMQRTPVALKAGRFDRPVTVLVNYR